MVEVINKIKEAEDNAEEIKKQARRAAAQIKEEAFVSGRRLLDEKNQMAMEESAAILEKAQAQAKEQLEHSRKESEQLCQELKTSANAKISQAAKVIVERIVDSV
ncbi:MAG: hypothetical protein ACOX0K_10410 [Oscillospiraceae bacterium]